MVERVIGNDEVGSSILPSSTSFPFHFIFLYTKRMAFVRFVLLAAVLGLSACAGVAPVPGGTDSVNEKQYASPSDFQSRVGQLQTGMPESLTLGILGVSRNDMRQMSRNEILSALYGANAMQLLDGPERRAEIGAFMETLYGYRLEYKNVEREHGFSSPWRIRTNENGYDYAVNLVFQNGVLYARPDLAGGVVRDTHSMTFFDYLTPGTFLSRVP